MKVLVTGAAGFLGASIVKQLLEAGDQVRAFDLSTDRRTAQEILGARVDDVEWLAGDISDARTVQDAMAGCDGVAHIAGILTPVCRADPILGARVNLLGTLNVFEAAKKHGIRRVTYTSSASVFGAGQVDYPEPSTHYGAFKLACEGSARAYFEDAGISSVGLRPLVAYGPGREIGPSAGASLACKAAALGRPFVIPFSARSGFVYASEVAQAIELGLRDKREGAFVYSMKGVVADVEEVVAEIRRLRPDAAISIDGPPIWINSDFDGEPIYKDMPALHRVSLREGIEKTYAHYQTQAAA